MLFVPVYGCHSAHWYAESAFGSILLCRRARIESIGSTWGSPCCIRIGEAIYRCRLPDHTETMNNQQVLEFD